MPEERIIAHLRTRNVQRFKGDMRSAAQSVDKYGRDSAEAARKTEVLKLVTDKLEKEALQAMVALRLQAAAVDKVGDEALETAGQLGLMRSAQLSGLLMFRRMQQSSARWLPNMSHEIRDVRYETDRAGASFRWLYNKGLPSLGSAFDGSSKALNRNLKSWSFWKDRLSLTRSELSSVILTLTGYLLPALISLASSATAAAIGGTAVLGASAGALAVGLLGTGLAAVTVAGQFQKVKTAQDAYNLSIQQYGAGSKEAASAAGKLYAVIRTQGGRPVWQAVRAWQAFRAEFTKTTAPARASLFGTMRSGLTFGRQALPTFGRETNRNAMALQRGLTGVFQALASPESLRTITVLSKTFRGMMGPASRTFINLWIVLGRILRAAAPWAVKWAQSWEITTNAWRRGTRDSGKLSKTIGSLVSQTVSWWRLAKAVGGLLLTIFQGTNKEGQSLVDTITLYVNKFDRWLQLQVQLGNFQRVLHLYHDSLGQIFQALGLLFSNPSAFLDKYLPIWVNYFAHVAGRMVLEFMKAWWNAGIWGKLFIPFLLGKWLFGANLFGMLGRLMAGRMVAAFTVSVAPRLVAAMGAEGLIASETAAAAVGLGTTIGVAIATGVTGVALAAFISDWINSELQKAGVKTTDPLKAYQQGQTPSPLVKPRGPVGAAQDLWNKLFKGEGGMIPMGTSAFVGDRGMEIATATPTGAMITPLGSGSVPSEEPRRGSLAVSDLLPPVHVHVHVDRREIGRANVNWNDERKSLRGQR